MQRGFLHGLLACVVLVVAFSHTDRPAHAQSLVDAARLARERREELGPPTKVYTTEDLPDVRRITEPTLAWVSRYRFLLEAALERERAHLELLRERSVMLPAPVPMKPLKMVPPDPAPAPPTIGIPLYSGLRGLSGLPGLSRVGSVAARPATTTFHNDLGAAAPVPTRGPCAGEPISNSDNTAPRHVWSTGRPVHQASRGQERVRTVEPTVPLHRPRSRGARRGSKSTRRPGYSSLMHTTVLPRPWLCSKSSNALTKSSRGKTRSTRGRITPVARKLMICATFC